MNRYIRHTIVVAVVTLVSVYGQSHAGDYGSHVGVAYLTKTDNTKIYSSDTGEEVDESVNKNFLLLAWDAPSIVHALAGASHVMASESQSNNRLHVRYFKNGKDREAGENTAWVNPNDVQRFNFDCCGDRQCSGIKSRMFATTTYADCLITARDKQLEVKPATAQSDDIEKLRLQIELERIKLEREKLNKQQ